MNDEIYEHQLNGVEDLLSCDPKFIDVLTSEERVLFEKYFRPDWDKVKDFREYRKELNANNPDEEVQAQKVYEKFIIACTPKGMNPDETLLPPR